MAYREEFPDFDYDLPTIAGFTDESWHNDTMPSLATADARLTLWCDYIDLAKRESDDGKRFALIAGEYGVGDEQVVLCESDDLDEVLRTLWSTARWSITSDRDDREGNKQFEASVYIPDDIAGGADIAERTFYSEAEAQAWLAATYPEVSEA